MKAVLIATAAALGLAACAQVQGVTRSTVHPLVDSYCADMTPEMRATARLSLGTTDAGNAIYVNCAVDEAEGSE